MACAFLTRPELLYSLLDQDTLKYVHERHPGKKSFNFLFRVYKVFQAWSKKLTHFSVAPVAFQIEWCPNPLKPSILVSGGATGAPLVW